LVVPPTFPETRERARTKTALLEPVRSAFNRSDPQRFRSVVSPSAKLKNPQ
jgi:hypothetical protein